MFKAAQLCRSIRSASETELMPRGVFVTLNVQKYSDLQGDQPALKGTCDVLPPPQTLDFETKTSYTLRVEASNRYMDTRFLSAGPFSDVATVRLQVEDMNEPPYFSPRVSQMAVSEAAPVGTEVGSVLAHDPDASNCPIR